MLLKPGQPLPAGKHIKCSECGTHFSVPSQNVGDEPQLIAVPAPSAAPNAPPSQPRLARDFEAEWQGELMSRPRRRRFRSKPAKAGRGLLIGMGVAFSVLLVAVVALAGMGWYQGWFGRVPVPSVLAVNPRVNLANFERVELGMTLAEVESILGRGSRISMLDLPDRNAGMERSWEAYADKYAVSEWYDWQNGSTHIYGGFGRTPSGRMVATLLVHHVGMHGGGGSTELLKGVSPSTFE
jgi:hypothetical protein